MFWSEKAAKTNDPKEEACSVCSRKNKADVEKHVTGK